MTGDADAPPRPHAGDLAMFAGWLVLASGWCVAVVWTAGGPVAVARKTWHFLVVLVPVAAWLAAAAAVAGLVAVVYYRALAWWFHGRHGRAVPRAPAKAKEDGGGA